MIDFDNAATTRPLHRIVGAIDDSIENHWGNPSSLHSIGVDAKRHMDACRSYIASCIGAANHNIVFTASGSEANALAIRGFVNNRIRRGIDAGVVVSATEHHDIHELIDFLPNNVKVLYVNPDKKTNMIEPCDVASAVNDMIKQGLDASNIIVSIMWVNNETGIINPVIDISHIVKSIGCTFHTDAVQYIPHFKVDMNNSLLSDIDMLTCSGHKLNTPRGIGFLYIRNIDDVKLDPIVYGSQEHGLRGGTENTAYIAALAEAFKYGNEQNKFICNADEFADAIAMRSKFETMLTGVGCIVNFDSVHRSPYIINIMLPGCNGESILYTLDMSGISVSTGSACNSKSFEYSRVLKAHGMDDSDIVRCVRVSFSENTATSDMEKFVEELDKAITIIGGDD